MCPCDIYGTWYTFFFARLAVALAVYLQGYVSVHSLPLPDCERTCAKIEEAFFRPKYFCLCSARFRHNWGNYSISLDSI